MTAVLVGRCARERLAERIRRERSNLSVLNTNRMGIDIYAERANAAAGHLGYLRGLSQRAACDEGPPCRGLRGIPCPHLRRDIAGPPDPLPTKNSNNAVVYYAFLASQKAVVEKIFKEIFAKHK